MLNIFSYACWPSICLSLEKCLFNSPAHFLSMLIVFIWCWVVWAIYIFWILTLIRYRIWKYFLLYKGCLFIFVKVLVFGFVFFFFLCKNLIKIYLFIFAFISFDLGDRSKKYCYNLCQRVFHLSFLLGHLWFQVLYSGL